MKRNLILVFASIFLMTSCNKNDDSDTEIAEIIKHYYDDYYFKQNYKIDFVDIKIKKRDSVNLDSVHQILLKNKLLIISNKICTSLNDSNKNIFNYISQSGQTDEYKNYVKELNMLIGQGDAGNGSNITFYLKFTLTNLNTNLKYNEILENYYIVLDKDNNVITVSKNNYKDLIKLNLKFANRLN
jgi:disulfide oxidoreductase YuzD